VHLEAYTLTTGKKLETKRPEQYCKTHSSIQYARSYCSIQAKARLYQQRPRKKASYGSEDPSQGHSTKAQPPQQYPLGNQGYHRQADEEPKEHYWNG
jgi:hypothetical protein